MTPIILAALVASTPHPLPFQECPATYSYNGSVVGYMACDWTWTPGAVPAGADSVTVEYNRALIEPYPVVGVNVVVWVSGTTGAMAAGQVQPNGGIATRPGLLFPLRLYSVDGRTINKGGME